LGRKTGKTGTEKRENGKTLRDRTRTGRPCGPAEFVERLEKLLGRPLAPNKRGRKPKNKKAKAE